MVLKTEDVAVVVPIYRSEITPDEEISLRHLRRFLDRYPKFFLAPESLKIEQSGFGIKRFKDNFFRDVTTYSALLLSDQFYETFSEYGYILVYQLDALVFSDQLLEWCAKGYDYIGAPWIKSPFVPFLESPRVGNGGFSLRRVDGFLKVLNSKVYFQDPDEYWMHFCAGRTSSQKLLNLPRKFLKKLSWFNGARWEAARWTKEGFSRFSANEDLFWSLRAPQYDPSFKIASVSEALKFSFEVEPRTCYEMNHHKLPFGCHGWAKYDRQFWEPFLLE
jgi:hypothetical protein